jgi:CHAD domain-containing protein
VSDPIAIAGVPAAPRRGARSSTRGAKLRLRRGIPLREAVLGAFRRILSTARRIASAAASNPVEAVHEYRKCVRRARAIVALLRPALGRAAARGLSDHLRSAFRETSVLRDSDVLFGTLSGIAGDDAELFVEAAEFAARMEKQKDGADAVKVLRRSAVQLQPLTAAMEVVLPPAFSTPDLERGLARSYRRTRQALEHAVETRVPSDFHEWRKREKELRYQLELLASGASRLLRHREKALGDLAQELGAVTDLNVLCRELETAPASSDAGNAGKLVERVRALSRQRADELLTRGSELFRDSPRDFALQVLAERG